MEINDKLLEKLAQLSALQLNSEEKAKISEYLQTTLSHFEKIKEIDTKDIESLISPLKPPLTVRADEVVDFPNKESILEQLPEKQAGLLKTPPIV